MDNVELIVYWAAHTFPLLVRNTLRSEELVGKCISFLSSFEEDRPVLPSMVLSAFITILGLIGREIIVVFGNDGFPTG